MSAFSGPKTPEEIKKLANKGRSLAEELTLLLAFR